MSLDETPLGRFVSLLDQFKQELAASDHRYLSGGTSSALALDIYNQLELARPDALRHAAQLSQDPLGASRVFTTVLAFCRQAAYWEYGTSSEEVMSRYFRGVRELEGAARPLRELLSLPAQPEPQASSSLAQPKEWEFSPGHYRYRGGPLTPLRHQLYRLLTAFVDAKEMILTHAQIISAVTDDDSSTRVYQYIGELNKDLRQQFQIDKNPIVPIQGGGAYRLDPTILVPTRGL
jgi:hypothetical protein